MPIFAPGTCSLTSKLGANCVRQSCTQYCILHPAPNIAPAGAGAPGAGGSPAGLLAPTGGHGSGAGGAISTYKVGETLAHIFYLEKVPKKGPKKCQHQSKKCTEIGGPLVNYLDILY